MMDPQTNIPLIPPILSTCGPAVITIPVNSIIKPIMICMVCERKTKQDFFFSSSNTFNQNEKLFSNDIKHKFLLPAFLDALPGNFPALRRPSVPDSEEQMRPLQPPSRSHRGRHG